MQSENRGMMPPPPPPASEHGISTPSGMYNAQLESLIEMALADGVLTEKEKQVLFKRAQALGIDLDEFEMVLDAKLYEKQKSHSRMDSTSMQGAHSAPQSSKCGDVRKCPACGAIIGTFLMACPECGYEFVGVGANSFVENFAKGLQAALANFDKAEMERKKMRNRQMGGLLGQLQVLANTDNYPDPTGEIRKAKLLQVEADYVKTAVLPRAKEDCIEMLNFLLPKIKVDGATIATKEWRKCYMAVLDKLEMGATASSELTSLVAYYRKQYEVSSWGKFSLWWSGMSQQKKVLVGVGIFYLVLMMIGVILAIFIG